INITDICQIFVSLTEKIKPIDIILCAWCIPFNKRLNDLLTELTEQGITIVASAGNFHEPIENYSPASAMGVITVGTLNKSGLIAALSNYSNSKSIVWIPGTNYNVGYRNSSGTSISAAIYCAFLAEARSQNDYKLLDKLIVEYKNKVFAELNKA
ncbi:MAG: S8 family serine peptidase, partial [Minisyncoccia bacterium]